MKIAVFRGAPRSGGITNKFADAFARGAAEKAEVDDIDLCGLSITPCRGCYACLSAPQNACAIADGFQRERLLERLAGADIAAFFTPVYFYAMSAQMKAFFDRCFPLAFAAGGGRLRGKKMLAFAAASGRMAAFGAVSKNFEMIAEGFGMELAANIRRGECVYFGGLGEGSLRVKKVLAAAEAAGRELAETGAVSPATVETLELPIAPSGEAFKKRAKIYWRIKTRGESDGGGRA